MKDVWERARSRLVPLLVVIIAFVQPAMIFIVWHFDISKDAVTVATAIDGVMGAVFTAGGLIVGLIAFYTLANVETVTKRAVADALTTIPDIVRTHTRSFVDAYNSFAQAQAVARRDDRYAEYSLDEIEGFLSAAYERESELPGLCSWAATTYWAALEYNINAAFGLISWYQRDPRLDIADAKRPLWIMHATEWTARAVLMQATVEPSLLRIRAYLAGLIREKPATVASLARAAYERDRSHRWSVAELVALLSCYREVDDVATITAAIDVPAPLSTGQVSQSIEALLKEAADRNVRYVSLTCLAFGNTARIPAQDAPSQPGLVRIIFRYDAEAPIGASPSGGSFLWQARVPTDMMYHTPRWPVPEENSGDAFASLDVTFGALVDQFSIVSIFPTP